MKERPILFNGEMVRAILDGRKTQTRRERDLEWANMSMPDMWDSVLMHDGGALFKLDDQGINRDCFIKCPYGKVGDRLWVRETFQPVFADGFDHDSNPYPDYKTGFGYAVTYPATDKIVEWIDCEDNITSRCRPSIHMPRWASRIQLEITDVRLEKIKNISDEDCIKEGIGGGFPVWKDYSGGGGFWFPRDSFQSLWDSINNNWDVNPWVWVIEFKVIK